MKPPAIANNEPCEHHYQSHLGRFRRLKRKTGDSKPAGSASNRGSKNQYSAKQYKRNKINQPRVSLINIDMQTGGREQRYRANYKSDYLNLLSWGWNTFIELSNTVTKKELLNIKKNELYYSTP